MLGREVAASRTRLEGTTWYYHHMWPAGYWQAWADFIIHRIHLRVLRHIKKLAEPSPSPRPAVLRDRNP